MESDITILKGLHPGIVLQNELKKKNLARGRFAISISEFPQTISAIINGRRGMNTPLSLKIEQALGMEEGYFMTLQVFYDIKQEKRRLVKNDHPDLSRIRPVLFWDTSIEKIEWQLQKEAIIKRVFGYGNEEEKEEISRFYGADMITQVLNRMK